MSADLDASDQPSIFVSSIVQEFFLKPGDCVTVTEPALLKTILGSCVAVAIFDPETTAAGLNHFLLPEAPPGLAPEQHGRYGDTSIALLLEDMARCGAEPARLVARIFGGGAVVHALTGEFRVGELNIEIARNLLRANGVDLLSEDVGGLEGRHVTFNTEDLSITVREIERSG